MRQASDLKYFLPFSTANKYTFCIVVCFVGEAFLDFGVALKLFKRGVVVLVHVLASQQLCICIYL